MSAEPIPHAHAWRVRPMRAEDLDRVHANERAVYAFPWSRGNFADSLSAGYDAWVFENADGMVGYAIVMWLPDEVHLLNISVDASRQGRGYGRAMLRWLYRNAAGRGARSILLEVRPSNLPARSLYLSEGFEQIGVRRRYYPAPGDAREDALVLRRMLGHG